jgi:hypothetical protein
MFSFCSRAVKQPNTEMAVKREKAIGGTADTCFGCG